MSSVKLFNSLILLLYVKLSFLWLRSISNLNALLTAGEHSVGVDLVLAAE
jgi:hypothetical protein